MKTSTVGLVLAAILMVLASIGFGIAQAGGNYTDGPVLCCVDQEALEQSDSSSPHALVFPSGIDLEDNVIILSTRILPMPIRISGDVCSISA
jgi:hypothetical protein